MNKILPCLICGYEPEPAFPRTDSNQPYKATTFVSHGQYGSTVFDPCTGSLFIEINICDDCLIAKSERVLLGRSVRPAPQVTYEPWDPTKEP